jgi:hypothetical protein
MLITDFHFLVGLRASHLKQELHCLSYIPIHFVLVIVEMGSQEYLPELASNHDPPGLSLPNN